MIDIGSMSSSLWTSLENWEYCLDSLKHWQPSLHENHIRYQSNLILTSSIASWKTDAKKKQEIKRKKEENMKVCNLLLFLLARFTPALNSFQNCCFYHLSIYLMTMISSLIILVHHQSRSGLIPPRNLGTKCTHEAHVTCPYNK